MQMKSNINQYSWIVLFSLVYYLLLSYCAASKDDRKVYILYMGNRPNSDISASASHSSMLEKVIGSGGSDSLIYSYQKSFNGFAAKLTHEEMLELADMDGVVSVFPSERLQLHTTRSWDFMGLSRNATRTSIESDIIIGVLDTGIWPESESFSDQGFGAPPKKWKGTCVSSSHFSCNNKIIGAKYYRSNKTVEPGTVLSPRDTKGHGSHTASTASGNPVSGANLFGLASGTARGAAPSARIAVYKICWFDGCYDADILAAFDDAISDGVDIISLSVGGYNAFDYFRDSIAIGAFHAMRKGILTSTSGGNSGPGPATITNVAPWMLSVAASTIDRKFYSKVLLGNGASYEGYSVNTFNLEDDMYPVIYAGDAPNVKDGYNASISRYCYENSLDANKVKGKVVFCDWITDTVSVLDAGGVGTIMQNGYQTDTAYCFPMPASYLDSDAGTRVFNYTNRNRKATATIFKSDERKDELAPYVASFSSRGPNPITRDILKPDIAAPGVDILAAWSQGNTITGMKGDNRVVKYNVDSGTSMACPHASGAAAYIKSFHPTWSPSAIKSALMTTASPMNPDINQDAEFAYGAGHLNPSMAINPGLVYDAGEADYVNFLCGQGYNIKQLQLVTGDNSSCSEATKQQVWNLNYPSFALSGRRGKSIARVFHRTVTNVGPASSNYRVLVQASPGLLVEVVPRVLGFNYTLQKLTFTVRVKAKMGDQELVSGSLAWDDGVHQVTSPIVAHVDEE